jgi:uncharacterized RDD family membrane protein YckC
MNDAPNDREGPVHSFLSPEAVRLDLSVAGPVPRMLAYAIDLVVIACVLIFLLIVLNLTLPIGAAIDKWFEGAVRTAVQNAQGVAKTNPQGGFHVEGLVIAVFLVGEFIVETGYFIFWEMASGGRSPGKLLIGLRVVRRNGLPIDIRSSIVRNLMRIVDMLPAEYLVGLISILLSPGSERLGDHVAGTLVLRLDRPETAAGNLVEGNATGVVLTREQLARIGPRELQLIRGVLRRASTLDESRGDALLGEAAEAMRVRLELAELPGPDRASFLRSLLATAERFGKSA